MKKQKQIQQALDALGWSHRIFAEIVYEELYEDEHGSSIDTDRHVNKKLAEIIKNQLQRSSTSNELLNRYIRTLEDHPDYQAFNLGNISMRYLDHDCISAELTEQLTNFSIELDSQNS